MSATNRILGESVTPEQRRIYRDPELAFRSAFRHGERFPEAEPYIIRDPSWAVLYAEHVIKDRWPEAEAVIAKRPYWAVMYALDVIKARWPEAEKAIATSNIHDDKYRYLDKFPEAKDDWLANGWIDWIDT